MKSLRDMFVSIAFEDKASKAVQDVGRSMDSVKDSMGGASSAAVEVGKTVNNAGSSMLASLESVGSQMQSVGTKMTLGITAPIMALGTAVAGITANLGWKRLVGLDTAQAQLEGLGYATEEVRRISEQVTTAIEGGMTTMAEGTSVAAGALAAGVKEGAELERYIKLVGDAAVGANRPVDDMAQIFNRVQGSGKLMTQELNMIEQGMPGFAQAMADSFGVTQDEFRKMVTDGKVSSAEYFDVMEDFAGGMAEAYSNSWEGMMKNTSAYIGIIGEQLLGGIFEESKESLAGFIDMLKSDAVMDWAERTGQKIGDAFTTVFETIKNVKQWFGELEPSMQGTIGKLVAFGTIGAATIGPVLAILGTAITAIGPAIAALSGPMGVVIAVMAGLVAAGVALYQNWDAIKSKAGETFSGIGETITGFVTGVILPALPMIKDSFTNVFESIWPVVETVGSILGNVGTIIMHLVENVVLPLIPVAHSIIISAFTAIQPVLNVVKTVFSTIASVVMFLVDNVIVPLIPVAQSIIETAFGLINPIIRIAAALFEQAWTVIQFLVENIVLPLVPLISSTISGMWDIVKPILDGIIIVFDGIADAIELAVGKFKAFADAASNFKMPKIGMPKWMGGNGVIQMGSHAAGLGRVPYDEYPMFAHKDEAVLTAEQSNALRNAGMLKGDGVGPTLDLSKSSTPVATGGTTTSSESNTFHFHINGGNAQDIAAEVKREIESLFESLGRRRPRTIEL